MISVLLLALSLSMDAAAAAVCYGAGSRALRLREGLVVGLWFGSFQTGMTWLGGLFGHVLAGQLWLAGRLLAFGLLLYLGLGMVRDGLFPRPEEAPPPSLQPMAMAALALATSLDALAAGVSLAYLGQGLALSAGVIGLVTFALSLLGVLLGKRLGSRWNRPAQLLGGLVLAGLGIHLLLG